MFVEQVAFAATAVSVEFFPSAVDKDIHHQGTGHIAGPRLSLRSLERDLISVAEFHTGLRTMHQYCLKNSC